jgi:hypothetical protein
MPSVTKRAKRRGGVPIEHRNPLSDLPTPKSRQVVYASSERIDALRGVLEDVMLQVFGFAPGEYFVSDESHASDMGREWRHVVRKVKRLYGVDLSDQPEPFLRQMLERIDATDWRSILRPARKQTVKH